MRDFWIKISYYWFLIVLFIVGLFCGGLNVKAETSDYTYKTYRVHYSNEGVSPGWTSVTNFNTSTAASNYITIDGLAVRFGWSSKFKTGVNYRVVVDAGFSPINQAISNGMLNVIDYTCAGSTSTSNWSADASLISSCNYVGATRVPNSNHIKYIFDISTASDIIGIQFNFFFPGATLVLNSVNVYNSSSITYGEDVGGAIDEQTIIIQEEFENITNTIINNNEELINAITENDKVCKTTSYNKSYVGTNGVYLNSTGSTVAGSSYGVSDWISINSESIITQSYHIASNRYACFYNSNKSPISCIAIASTTDNTTYTIPSGAVYFRYTYHTGVSREIFNITTCLSGNQSIEDTLTDSSVDDPSSSFEDMQDLLPTNGTITQLIALPLSLYQKVLNSINGTCSSFNLGSLYGTNLIMPCINLSSYLGSTLWGTIDLILSGIFVLTIARKMIKAFEGFTSMKEGDVIND